MSQLAHETNIAWRIVPAVERPGKAALGMTIMLGIAAAVWYSFGPLWAGASLLVLFLSLNRFYLPTTFRMDETGISAHYPLRKQHMRWEHVRRFLHDRHGGYLSHRAKRSWTDAYGGMHLIFGAQRDAVVANIQARIAQHRTVTPAAASLAAPGAPPCR